MNNLRNYVITKNNKSLFYRFKLLIFLIIVFSTNSILAEGKKKMSQQIEWKKGEKKEIASQIQFKNQITVSATVESLESNPETMQVIAAKWKINENSDSFDAYDATSTDGLDTGGFLGAIFDGRYVYFSPQHDSEGRHGKVLRYDSYGDFHNSKSWTAYDAGNTDGLNTKGFYGGVFDGQYVYFTPRNDGTQYHTRTLRYNTKKDFKDQSAWEAFDAGLGTSYQGAGFDGRYVYFAPGTANETGQSGTMLRYDTREDFKTKSSWQTFDVKNLFPGLNTKDFDGVAFAGKYIYFVPLKYNVVVRYNTEKPFDDKNSWQAFDAGELGMKYCVGSTFDGRYLYFVPYDNKIVVRYDTEKDFEGKNSWQAFDITQTNGAKSQGGFDGAFFDGRYVYFIPFYYTDSDKKMNFHGELLRFDTKKDFEDPSSWKATDISNTSGLNTVGYNAGIFDGRYFYFAPWHDGEAYHKGGKIVGHGKVIRYDSCGDNGTFILKYCDYGHNGGLSGAVPGPSFIVNTDKGPRSISANRILRPGKHTITGSYDGKDIQLYIDGKLTVQREADGNIINNNTDINIGNIHGANMAFKGNIEEVLISNQAENE